MKGFVLEDPCFMHNIGRQFIPLKIPYTLTKKCKFFFSCFFICDMEININIGKILKTIVRLI